MPYYGHNSKVDQIPRDRDLICSLQGSEVNEYIKTGFIKEKKITHKIITELILLK